MNGPYDIIFACDARGATPLSVAVWSVVEQANPETVYHIRILSDNLPTETKETLRSLVARGGERHLISFHEMCDMISEDLRVTSTFPRATWARIYLAQYFPEIERALYLDIDTLCCTDLTCLLETDMGESAVGGVLEQKSAADSNFNKRLHIPLSSPGYINAGVLLLNLASIRRENLVQKMIAYYRTVRKEAYALDQDTINGALYDRILPIHPRWNWNDGKTRRLAFVPASLREWKGYPLAESVEAALYPGILHYWGGNKPWFYNHRPERKRYEQSMQRAGLIGPEGLPGFSWKIRLKQLTHEPLYRHARRRVKALARQLGVDLTK